MKMLDEQEFERFCSEFPKVPSVVIPGKLLIEEMNFRGCNVQLAVAWRHYSLANNQAKLQ